MLPRELLAFGESPPPPVAPPQGTDPSDAFARLRWLAVPGLVKDGAPVRVLDCRALSLSMTSMTSSAEVAARFTQLRTDGGARLADVSVNDALRTPCDLLLAGIRDDDGPIFRAPEMEWKWDASRVGRRLLFSRSWSGDLQAAATIDERPDGPHLVDLEVAAKLCGDDARTAVCLVQYLVRVMLEGKVTPHPVPAVAPTSSVQELFMYSWSLHGRAAFFALPMTSI
jgi:hypothetical protein